MFYDTANTTKKSLEKIDHQVNRLDEIVNNSKIKVFKDSETAYVELKKNILSLLQSGEEININIIAVSMKFSWNFFDSLISNHFNTYRNQINFKILLVNPDFLNNKPEWKEFKEITESNINTLKTFKKPDNVSVKAWLYNNIPQFHGIIINNTLLFRGEVSFDFNSSHEPQIHLGDRGYSMLANVEDQSKTFRNWFDYYQFIGVQEIDR